jgi:hypothetical protein
MAWFLLPVSPPSITRTFYEFGDLPIHSDTREYLPDHNLEASFLFVTCLTYHVFFFPLQYLLSQGPFTSSATFQSTWTPEPVFPITTLKPFSCSSHALHSMCSLSHFTTIHHRDCRWVWQPSNPLRYQNISPQSWLWSHFPFHHWSDIACVLLPTSTPCVTRTFCMLHNLNRLDHFISNLSADTLLSVQMPTFNDVIPNHCL